MHLKDVYIHLQKSLQKVFAGGAWMDNSVSFLFWFLFLFVSSLRCYFLIQLKVRNCDNFLCFFCKRCFSACAGPQHNRPSASVEVQLRLARFFFPLTIWQIQNMSRNNFGFDFGRTQHLEAFKSKRKNYKPVRTKVSTEPAVHSSH